MNSPDYWLPFFPERASTLADQFEALFWYIAITSGAVGAGVYAAIFYFCVRYRRSVSPGPTPRILGSHKLELAWTVIPLFVFLSYFAWGLAVYNYAVHPPEDSMEVFVIGKQWMWKAQYPDGHRVIIGGNPRNMSEAERANIGKLVLPLHRPTRVTITSEDVIHDFGIPAFRSKMDALPGRYTTAWYLPTKLGEYHIFCDQYCGTWHSLMVGKVKVVTGEEFDQWLAGHTPLQGTDNAVDGSPASAGQQLFLQLQCINCHSANAQGRAPVLEGLYGQRVPLGRRRRNRRRPLHHGIHPPPAAEGRGRVGGHHAGLRREPSKRRATEPVGGVHSQSEEGFDAGEQPAVPRAQRRADRAHGQGFWGG
jgi:cytochrome c oxidase subunit II